MKYREPQKLRHDLGISTGMLTAHTPWGYVACSRGVPQGSAWHTKPHCPECLRAKTERTALDTEGPRVSNTVAVQCCLPLIQGNASQR